MDSMSLLILGVILLVTLALYNAVRTWIEYRKDGTFTYQWQSVLDFALTAVAAVSQTHKEKPDGMSDADWNHLRFQEAMVMVESFAKQFGITINPDNYAAIQAAIEYAVGYLKKESGDRALIARTGPL